MASELNYSVTTKPLQQKPTMANRIGIRPIGSTSISGHTFRAIPWHKKPKVVEKTQKCSLEDTHWRMKLIPKD
jgi:hypothetical protein